MSWYEGPLAAFGATTTGPDAEGDRIVRAVLAVQDGPDATPRVTRWLVDPGVPVPRECGLTDDFLHRNGRWPAPAVHEVAAAVARHCAAGVPLVALDARFVLTVLDRELRRHRASHLARYLEWECAALHVLDPRLLDRHLDHYRRELRGAADLCARYGVRWESPADAATGTLAALEVARRVGRRFAARLGRLTAPEVHRLQAAWHTAHRRRQRGWFGAFDGHDGGGDGDGWPLGPGPSAEAA